MKQRKQERVGGSRFRPCVSHAFKEYVPGCTDTFFFPLVRLQGKNANAENMT